jgi:hypothetical protein
MFRLFMLGAALSTDGKQHKAKPINPGIIGLLTIIVCVGVFAWGDASHHWTVLWFIVVPLICAFGIGFGSIVHAAQTTPRRAQNRDEIARMRQVRTLIATRCPTCKAQPGTTCKVTAIDVPYVLLDEKWRTFAHFSRIELAVARHLINRDDIIAQFGGHVPEGLKI